MEGGGGMEKLRLKLTSATVEVDIEAELGNCTDLWKLMGKKLPKILCSSKSVHNFLKKCLQVMLFCAWTDKMDGPDGQSKTYRLDRPARQTG